MKKRISKPLPMFDADGKRRHPLVILAARTPMKDIGKLLGHSNHTTASIYVGRARKTPTLTIPAEWALPLARHMGVPPHDLRPDLYLPHWTV